MIVKAKREDLSAILKIFEHAKSIMRQSGNYDQWSNGYPQKERLLEDIAKGQLYLLRSSEAIEACFVILETKEPTYSHIEGAWRDDSPYVTIHRLAKGPKGKDVFKSAFEKAKSLCGHIRIDTHRDNKIMQHLITKYGFVYCGIIYLEDGSERLAYEYCEDIKTGLK